jgi:hypothetical protein
MRAVDEGPTLRAGGPLRAALLCLLALLLPFETRRGIFDLGPVTMTNLELVLWAYLLVYFVFAAARTIPQLTAEGLIPGLRGLVWSPNPGWRLPPEGWASLAWILVLIVAALLAPADVRQSLKFAARLTIGVLFFWCALHDLSLPRSRRAVAACLLAGGLLAAVVGIWETYRLGDFSGPLSIFRTEITTVEGELRLTGPYQQANIAAGALELLIPIALAVAVVSLVLRARLRLVVLSLVSLWVLCAATILTLSRAGLVAGLLAVLVPFLLIFRVFPRRSIRWAAAIGLAAFGAALLFTSATVPQVRERMTTLRAPSYGVAYRVDSLAVVSEGGPSEIPVLLKNTGNLSWRTDGNFPVALSYHWISSDGRTDVFEGVRTRLPHSVPPGDSVLVRATVDPPARPGDYLLLWDMVKEHVTWFSQTNNASAKTYVQVQLRRGELLAARRMEQWARNVVGKIPPWSLYDTVPRRSLWTIALTLARRSPLLGVGPGRFGRCYPSYLPPGNYNPQLSSHDLFLELAATAGLLGLAAFIALMYYLVRRFYRALRSQAQSSTTAPGAAGDLTRTRIERVIWLCAGLGIIAAFLCHGVLDCFLESHAVMGTFWLGLALCAAGTVPANHATLVPRRP